MHITDTELNFQASKTPGKRQSDRKRTSGLLAESQGAKKPKSSGLDPNRLKSINFVFVKYIDGKFYFAKELKQGYKYCETPIAKMRGVMELASEYKFNGEKVQTCKVIAAVPREYISFCGKLCLSNEQRATLGSHLHDYVK